MTVLIVFMTLALLNFRKGLRDKSELLKLCVCVPACACVCACIDMSIINSSKLSIFSCLVRPPLHRYLSRVQRPGLMNS